MANDSTASSRRTLRTSRSQLDEIGHVLDDVRGNHIVEWNVGLDRLAYRSVRDIVDRHDRIDIETVVRGIPGAEGVGVDMIEVADVAHLASDDGIRQRAQFETFRRGDIDRPQQPIDAASHARDPSDPAPSWGSDGTARRVSGRCRRTGTRRSAGRAGS